MHAGACWRWEDLLALLDVGSPPLDGEHQALVPEDRDGPEHGVPADVVLLLRLLTRGERPLPPLPGAKLPG